MKKLVIFLFAATILFGQACKKDDDSATAQQSTNAAAGSWKLDATSYDVKYTAKTQTSGGETLIIFADAAITGANSTANTLNLSFRVAPTASGTYQLISSGGTTTGNQVQISAGGPAGSYAYIGANISIEVTVSGGKVKVKLPEISMKSTGQGANVYLTGTIQEI